ncbi:unnamed protein product [Bursaphelenchus okinawaensis]|uniref:Uncharacterized protein n=1 Tax=Bursaphelenchus okinawaensis TaxID=465554 RepID=A0A811KG23_9BILA|nr:unnamed protein product [Bursaphelenchus okinawaensis]CAG9102482.1 unnamed protein product [Bursaphelenchus okinawaensis]
MLLILYATTGIGTRNIDFEAQREQQEAGVVDIGSGFYAGSAGASSQVNGTRFKTKLSLSTIIRRISYDQNVDLFYNSIDSDVCNNGPIYFGDFEHIKSRRSTSRKSEKSDGSSKKKLNKEEKKKSKKRPHRKFPQPRLLPGQPKNKPEDIDAAVSEHLNRVTKVGQETTQNKNVENAKGNIQVVRQSSDLNIVYNVLVSTDSLPKDPPIDNINFYGILKHCGITVRTIPYERRVQYNVRYGLEY